MLPQNCKVTKIMDKSFVYIIIAVAIYEISFCDAQSKCTDIIDYRKVENEWRGKFYVRPKYSPTNEIVSVRVYTTADDSHDIGLAVQETEEEIKSQYESDKPMRLMIVFSDYLPFPPITKIELRTDDICQILCSSPDETSPDKLETFLSINFFPKGKILDDKETDCDGKFTVYQETPAEDQFNSDICGKPVIEPAVVGLAIRGAEIERGSWPWLVAIYLNQNSNLKFLCGGSLISTRAVISAAHCFVTNAERYSEKDLNLFMGRHSTRAWNENGSFSYSVERLFVHPDYRPGHGNYDGDIALMLTNLPVSFTDIIRPVCIWDGEPLIDALAGWDSSVVGWGRDEHGPISAVPKRIEARIVTEEECIKSNEAFAAITTRRNFCAGNLDGSGPCDGDSGGGLMVFHNGRWWIRGSVSASFFDTVTGTCDVMSYSVYSDIVKYKDWIYRKSRSI